MESIFEGSPRIAELRSIVTKGMADKCSPDGKLSSDGAFSFPSYSLSPLLGPVVGIEVVGENCLDATVAASAANEYVLPVTGHAGLSGYSWPRCLPA